jgi:hypothetical protein
MARDFSTVEREYNSAKANFDQYKISANPDGSYTVGTTRYSAVEFGRLRRTAETAFKKIEKEYKVARQKEGQRKQTEKQRTGGLQRELTNLRNTNKELAGLLAAGKNGPGGRPVSQATIDANNDRIALIERELSVAPVTQTQAQATTTTPASGRSPVSADAAERRALGTTATPAVATPTGGGLGGGLSTGGTGGAGGGGGGGTGTGTGRGGRTPKPKLPRNWEAKFREMFPAQSWLLDIDRAKYPALFTLIQRGVQDKMWETPESQARFAAELNNTDFFTELKTKNVVRDVKAVVGDLGFDSVPFNKFLTTAMNFGWEGDVLKSEVYKEAFRKDDDGNFVNQTAVTRAKASTDYKKAQAFGRAFFSTVSDSTIEQRLTGVITDEDIIRQQRELAKTRYAHLGNLIDQGLTLEDIAGSFQQQAARILERDVNSIDMGSADFETAFNFGEPGQKRMMSTGEWEIMLRSDAKYGWDKTENAKQEARGLAASIAQAFGKVI